MRCTLDGRGLDRRQRRLRRRHRRLRVGHQRQRRLQRRRHRRRRGQPGHALGHAHNLRKFADPQTGLPNNTVTLRVRDTFGATSTVNTTVTIYQAAPIATVVQSPNPAPINLVTGFSNPTLNGQESRSPIPGMTIASL